MPTTHCMLQLDPGGLSTVVSLYGPTGSAATLTSYTAKNGASTHSFPETITTPTTYWFTYDHYFPVTVSAKVNGVESANGAGSTITINMDRGVMETIAIGLSGSEVATAIAGIATLATNTTLAEGVNIITGTTTGSQIATGATQKLGFYGITPVVQRGAYTQTYSTASRTVPAATYAATGTAFPAGGTGAAAGGWDTAGHRDAAIASFAALLADVVALAADVLVLKQLIGSLIDDSQALGFAT